MGNAGQTVLGHHPNSLRKKTRHRQVTDLDVTVLGFSGPGLPFPRQVLCGDAPRLFFFHFSVHLSSVLGRTELCHEVWTPGPQNSNENHHLALLEKSFCSTFGSRCPPRAERTEEMKRQGRSPGPGRNFISPPPPIFGHTAF